MNRHALSDAEWENIRDIAEYKPKAGPRPKNVLSVDFEWALNTSHGADYFRRWRRQKANSGGLMVHRRRAISTCRCISPATAAFRARR